MSEKITSNVFYVSFIAVLLSIIATTVIIFGLWNKSTVNMLENQG